MDQAWQPTSIERAHSCASQSERRHMTHDEKVQYLLKDLGQRGIGKNAIAPPFYRLLWRLGIEVRPPLFASFWSFAMVTGLGFGVVWGLIIAFLQQSYPASCALWTAPVGGALFGSTMAAYLRWQAHKFALPRWEDYPV